MDTLWTPELAERGPRYRVLADEIARAVEEGRLGPGQKLPPVRDLAWTLKISPGAVARAYQLAERRGLVQGEVGRGTFVRGRDQIDASEPLGRLLPPSGAPSAIADGVIDLRHNHAPAVGQDEMITEALSRLIATRGVLPFTAFDHARADRTERAVLVDWLNGHGLPARLDDSAFAIGAQHGVFVACASCLGGRDAVALTHGMIHPSLKDCARSLGVRLEPVAADEHGLTPDAIEEAIERFRPGALLVNANLQNPSLVTMPLARREAIAEIALRRRLPIIEDDVYGWADPGARLPSFSSLAPDLSWYVASLSKCASSMMRAGFVLAPPGHGPRMARLMKSVTSHTPYLTSLLVAELIRSGDLDTIIRRVGDETTARLQMVREILGPVFAGLEDAELVTADRGVFAWMRLPDPWRASDLDAAAQSEGVLLSAAEVFSVGRAPAPHAARISFGAPRDRESLAQGLGVVVDLVRAGPAPTDAAA